VERRGQAIRVMINLVNWQQEEPTGCGGGRQPSLDGTSRVNREVYARFCEGLGVQLPGPTRRCWVTGIPTATLPLHPFFPCVLRTFSWRSSRSFLIVRAAPTLALLAGSDLFICPTAD
jgi:hypothetical protein